MDNETDITHQLKLKIISNYLLKTQIKVMCMKRRTISRLEEMSHIQHIMTLQNIDTNKDLKFLTENFQEYIHPHKIKANLEEDEDQELMTELEAKL